MKAKINMKNTIIAAFLLSLFGCASTHTFQASPQHYRAKGEDKQIEITGQVKQDHEFKITGDTSSNKVTIFFDGKTQIEGFLDNRGFGEFSGQTYHEKNTTASCSSKKVSKGWVEIKCIVFIDNERAATLTM